jgi:hypothetical protein
MPKPEPKDYVKRHLAKQKVDPDSLSKAMIEALNAFSEDEYENTKVMDKLGDALLKDPLPPDQKISAVH